MEIEDFIIYALLYLQFSYLFRNWKSTHINYYYWVKYIEFCESPEIIYLRLGVYFVRLRQLYSDVARNMFAVLFLVKVVKFELEHHLHLSEKKPHLTQFHFQESFRMRPQLKVCTNFLTENWRKIHISYNLVASLLNHLADSISKIHSTQYTHIQKN